MSLKQKKIKSKPRIRLNHNKCIFMDLRLQIQLQVTVFKKIIINFLFKCNP